MELTRIGKRKRFRLDSFDLALESESRLKVIYEKAGFGLERDRQV
jgi:hypothetical protein